MKALTLHQPWASLIAVGLKTVETRSWSTKHRGPIAIHAGKQQMAGEIPLRLWWDNHDVLEPQIDTADWETLPLGKVVALANLVDVVPISELAWTQTLSITEHFLQMDGGRCHIAESERPFGDYHHGRFAWLLENITPLRVPTSAIGRQGLWNWDPPTE